MSYGENSLKIKTTDIGSIYCVGRNYAAHAKELNNPIPKSPLIFTKTRSTLCDLEHQLIIPASLGRCDHETEIAILLSDDLYQADAAQVTQAIGHYGLALDLTLRDKQSELKQKGHPWTLAKNFINATPIAPLQPVTSQTDLSCIDFSLTINGKVQQHGNSANMLFEIIEFIIFLSEHIPLNKGDLILTGTPEGVGPLNDRDQITLSLNGATVAQAEVCRP